MTTTATNRVMTGADALRDEVRMLDSLLDEVVAELEGRAVVDTLEEVRSLAGARRAGDSDAEAKLVASISAMDAALIGPIVQALSTFFDLANLAEDRHRVRVLRERERERHPDPRAESIGDAVAQLAAAGLSAEQVQVLIDRLSIELVFTAHPTEAKRKSVREKIRDLRDHLHLLDQRDLLPREQQRLMQRIRADLTALWQTDTLRTRKPTVLEEVERGLFFSTTLWDVLPQLYEDVREALTTHYSETKFHIPPFLRFGSWIGGDRDGNPNVTIDATRSTLMRLREVALERHHVQCRRLRRSLSMSKRRAGIPKFFLDALDEARGRWTATKPLLEPIAQNEPYRLWLRIVQWRIEQTQRAKPFTSLPEGAYRNSAELHEELALMRRTLHDHPGGAMVSSLLDEWLCQLEIFGFHMMRLDIREESSRYHAAMHEVLRAIGASDTYLDLDETGRVETLTQSMNYAEDIDESRLSDHAREIVGLFRLLAETSSMNGPDSLGAHVISMTHEPSDVLAVLWLSKWAGRMSGNVELDHMMPIVPLFETIEDLRRAPQTLDAMLKHPRYREHVDRDDSRQVIMIGYSDSTKDGGYLAACWRLHEAQVQLRKIAHQHGVRAIFFHGRGGSLGRGGGPAARSILSLPPDTVDGAVRITEQGEVLAERYDDPQVAYRHLEQVTWATMLVSAATPRDLPAEWRSMMESLAEDAFRAYRRLVEQPGFLRYFDLATPISEIEQLPIGSRPARRSGQRSLKDLRAIPWVFSWTQNRHFLPAWYGLGAAIDSRTSTEPGTQQSLREMYQHWPFFQATIDNAALALAKADVGIARHYAELLPEPTERSAIWSMIVEEFERSKRSVLALAGVEELLDSVPWLKRSIEVRNPHVDPINLIQIELFQRVRTAEADEAEVESLRWLVRMSIQGIAAGLRTTG